MVYKTYFKSLVSRIAQDILERESPDVYTKVMNDLRFYKVFNSTYLIAEQNQTFVEAAQFADMIKYNGGGF